MGQSPRTIISNNRINAIIKEYVRKVCPIGEQDVILVSLPQEAAKGRRFLYNLHVHNVPRKVDGDYILVALNEKPPNDRGKRLDLDIRAVYRIPPQCFDGKKTFTLPYGDLKPGSWVSQYRIL